METTSRQIIMANNMVKTIHQEKNKCIKNRNLMTLAQDLKQNVPISSNVT